MSRVIRKPAFCICENKDADQRLGFRYKDAILVLTIPLLAKYEFLASSHLLWLYSPVCVGPRQKPGRPIFSHRDASYFRLKMNIQLILYLCLAMSVGAVAATHSHQTSAPKSFYHYLQEKTRSVRHEIFDMKTQIQECCNPAG